MTSSLGEALHRYATVLQAKGNLAGAAENARGAAEATVQIVERPTTAHVASPRSSFMKKVCQELILLLQVSKEDPAGVCRFSLEKGEFVESWIRDIESDEDSMSGVVDSLKKLYSTLAKIADDKGLPDTGLEARKRLLRVHLRCLQYLTTDQEAMEKVRCVTTQIDRQRYAPAAYFCFGRHLG